MRFGYLTLSDAGGIRPDTLARELEERGFDSLWLPEHTNIPIRRATPYPGGGELPAAYYTMMNPFVAGMAAAAATANLTIATGVCLVLQHDLIDLAKAAATLDVLSGGRLLLGVGVGWNREELANSRPELPFASRYRALEERVSALRTIWEQDAPAFSGVWDRFEAAVIEPKPTRSRIPIALGNAGPLGIGHAARYADEWCPIDASILNVNGRPDTTGGIALFRRLAEEAGRADPDSIPITVFAWTMPPPQRIEQYRKAGVARLVAAPPTMHAHDPGATLADLDRWQPFVGEFR